jgi:NADH:ubiquinone oxidoreductase subunit H
MLVLLIKTTILISIAILVRGTLPRYRVDQVINLNWKFLVFILVLFYLELILLNIFLFKLV